jgi:hypothetical protein
VHRSIFFCGYRESNGGGGIQDDEHARSACRRAASGVLMSGAN